MDITIRHVEAKDSEAVHQIFLGERVIWGTMRLPHDALDNTRRRLESGEGSIRLVAELNEEVVGFAELLTFPNVPRHRHVGEVNLIAVRDDRHGRGIGRKLMQALVDLADQWLQISKLNLLVWQDNHGAIHLYRQFGFEIEGTISHYAFRQGEYVDAHLMGRVRPKAAKKRAGRQQVPISMPINGFAKTTASLFK